MPVGNFNLPLQGDYWEPQPDWIDISSVNNNEINILVNGGPIKFIVDVASSGTYSIDWGDGVVETSRASGTGYYHNYSGSTGGTVCSLGYNTWKITIYNATADITRFRFTGLSSGDLGYNKNVYYVPALWVVMGTTGLTSLNSAFGGSNNFGCYILEAVYLPSTYTSMTNFGSTFTSCPNLKLVKNFNVPWGNVTDCSSTFRLCENLRQINFPTTLPNTITTMNAMFQSCPALEYVYFSSNFPNSCTSFVNMFDACAALKYFPFPSAWPTTASAVNMQAMFRNCRSIKKITLPSSWPTLLNSVGLSFMFQNCYALEDINWPSAGFPNGATSLQETFNTAVSLVEVNLGSSWNSITTTTSMFVNCSNLKKITLPTNIGSITSAIGMFAGCGSLETIVNEGSIGTSAAGAGANFDTINGGSTVGSFVTGWTTNSYLSKFGVQGTSTNVNWFESIRLTQAGSTYTGSSPQINVSFNRLGQAALVQIFNDLPTVTAKTINITSNPGAALLTAGERAIATGKGWTITG